jgi:hypothetical protein
MYLGVSAVAHLAWETLELPLYTIWSSGTLREKAFAVVHCTAGDVLIALSTLAIALIAIGTANWPVEGFQRVLILTLILGVGYTIFSEWLNIVIRASWAYSSLMPVVPVINTGLSPLMQWVIVPNLALFFAKRRHTRVGKEADASVVASRSHGRGRGGER